MSRSRSRRRSRGRSRRCIRGRKRMRRQEEGPEFEQE